MSQFGQGLTYCLGLFLEQTNKINDLIELQEEFGVESSVNPYAKWFMLAGNHVRGLQSRSAPTEQILRRCLSFQLRVMALIDPWFSPQATEADFHWAIQEARDLLREIDAAHGVPTIKVEYE